MQKVILTIKYALAENDIRVGTTLNRPKSRKVYESIEQIVYDFSYALYDIVLKTLNEERRRQIG